MLTILLVLALFFLFLKINILDIGILIITINKQIMKTLFIIYVLLSVLVVLFCWIVNHNLKKQLTDAQISHKATIAELADKQNELVDLLKSFNEYNINDAKHFVDAYTESNNYFRDIVEILFDRHGYGNLDDFGVIRVEELLEFVKNNDTSKKNQEKYRMLSNAFELTKQILHILLPRHGYDCSDYQDWLEILEYVKSNDLSKKKRTRKSGDKDKAE